MSPIYFPSNVSVRLKNANVDLFLTLSPLFVALENQSTRTSYLEQEIPLALSSGARFHASPQYIFTAASMTPFHAVSRSSVPLIDQFTKCTFRSAPLALCRVARHVAYRLSRLHGLILRGVRSSLIITCPPNGPERARVRY